MVGMERRLFPIPVNKLPFNNFKKGSEKDRGTISSLNTLRYISDCIMLREMLLIVSEKHHSNLVKLHFRGRKGEWKRIQQHF